MSASAGKRAATCRQGGIENFFLPLLALRLGSNFSDFNFHLPGDYTGSPVCQRFGRCE